MKKIFCPYQAGEYITKMSHETTRLADSWPINPLWLCFYWHKGKNPFDATMPVNSSLKKPLKPPAWLIHDCDSSMTTSQWHNEKNLLSPPSWWVHHKNILWDHQPGWFMTEKIHCCCHSGDIMKKVLLTPPSWWVHT